MSGLKPIRRANGAPYMGDVTHYPVDPTNATKIYAGDPVKLASGYIVRADGSAGEAFIGVFTGCEYKNSAAPGGYTFSNHWNGIEPEAGATVTALVADGPDLVFDIEYTKAGGAAVPGDLGQTYTVSLGSGDDATGRSTAVLGTTSGTGPVFALPLTVAPHPSDPKIAGSAHTYRVQVTAALHQLAGSAA